MQNAVLIMHGTTGSGAQFLSPVFADELFGPGQPLDVSKLFIILPDDIGHGQSSRPSEGLHARFPNYRYADMVEAEHRLVVDGLHVDHLRLVMGTSMGGMRSLLVDIYPAGLRDAGLEPALRDLAERRYPHPGVRVAVEHDLGRTGRITEDAGVDAVGGRTRFAPVAVETDVPPGRG